MKNIRGFKIDWNRAEVSIQLPIEFTGQSTAFQAKVISGWIEQLHSMLRLIEAKDRKIQDVIGLDPEEILAQKHQILFREKHPVQNVWLLLSVGIVKSRRHLFLWQATQSGAYQPIHQFSFEKRGIKNIDRLCRDVHKEWSESITRYCEMTSIRASQAGGALTAQQARDAFLSSGSTINKFISDSASEMH